MNPSKLKKIVDECDQLAKDLGVIEQLYMCNGQPVIRSKEQAVGLMEILSEDIKPRVCSVRVTAAELTHELQQQ
jgi:hypothetical protein